MLLYAKKNIYPVPVPQHVEYFPSNKHTANPFRLVSTENAHISSRKEKHANVKYYYGATI